MRPRCCHYCGQEIPETRLGVRLTAFKSRIFDIVVRAGPDGIAGHDLFDMVYTNADGDRSFGTLKAHIWQINDHIRDEGYEIRGAGQDAGPGAISYYRLCKVKTHESAAGVGGEN